MVGFGTYLITNDDAESIVLEALRNGYRHVDTAEGYQNESGVGVAIQKATAELGLTREDIFVTTKLWPGNAAWGQQVKNKEGTIEALNNSLARLQLDYVDLYLIHAPTAGDLRIAQWEGMLALQEQGKAKAIGVSNFNISHFEEIKAAGLPLPAVNQIELHPWSQKPELIAYMEANNISAIAYSSLAPLSTWRTAEGQSSAKTDQMQADGEHDEAPFKVMAEKYGVSEAQVLLRWGVQMGYPVLPKSMNIGRLQKNIDLFSFSIDDEDMTSIKSMDRGEGIAWAIGDPTKIA